MFHVNPVLEDSHEISSRQRIHMKHQDLFFLENNKKKVFINVVCCSRDWRFKHQHINFDLDSA